MRGYNRVDEDLDEYEAEGLDDYEEGSDGYGAEGEEYAEDDEEEEVKEEPKEILEYLELRRKLKEAARKNLAKQSGSGSDARDSKRSKLDKFGSFFGPSRPLISERVIQESKSFLETQQEAPRVSSSQKDSKRGPVSGTSAHSNGKTERRPLNPIKEKAQKLKVTRDYSFLMSDDADVPRPANGSRAVNAPGTTSDPPARSNTGARPVQVPSKSREAGNSSRRLPDGAEERRPGVPGNSHNRPSKSTVHQRPSSSIRPDSRRLERPAIPEHKRQPSASGRGSGTVRPDAPRDTPSKNTSQLVKKTPSHVDRRVSSAPVERRAPAAALERKPSMKVVKGAVPNVQRPQVLKSQANGVRHHPEERMSKSQANGVRQYPEERMSKSLANGAKQYPEERMSKSQANGVRQHSGERMLKSQANGVGQHSEERVSQVSKAKILSKQTSSSSRPQSVHSSQIKAPKQVPSRLSREEDSYRSRPQPKPQPKLKPKPRPDRIFSDDEDDDFDEDDPLAALRKITRYNPSKFAGRDDDDGSDMEADFRTIQMEENRSSRIAREEDEREWKLIQEEEERERRRKLAKRKVSQR